MKKSLLSILLIFSTIEVFAMEAPESLEVAGKTYYKKSPLREARPGRPLKVILSNNTGTDVWMRIKFGRKALDPKRRRFDEGAGFIYAPGLQSQEDPQVFKLPNNSAISVNYLPKDVEMTIRTWPVGSTEAAGDSAALPESRYWGFKLEISGGKLKLSQYKFGEKEEADLKIIPTIKYEKAD